MKYLFGGVSTTAFISVLLICFAPRPAVASDGEGSAVPSKKEQPSFLSEMTHPVSWFSWGFDTRNRWEHHRNASTLQDGPESEFSYLRLRNRLTLNLEPGADLLLRARFISEPRYYFRPDSRDGWANQEGLFDNLYLEATNLFGQPLRARIGRQEIYFGNRWLVFDATPGDGSRTEFFDAARFTFDLEDGKTTIDIVGVAMGTDTDEFLPVMNHRNDALAEQDERDAMLYVSREFSPNFRLDGHYFYRHMTRPRSNGDEGDLHVPGVRASGKVGLWDYLAETAIELGEKNGKDLAAWGLNSELGLRLGGAWKHRVHVGYEFLSGDDPNSAQDEGWDMMWGRRARWSELMVFTFGAEADGKRGYYSNLHRPTVGWTAAPTQVLNLSLNYMPLFAVTNPQRNLEFFSEDGKFRGHYIQAVARFKFSEHLTAHLWNELFFPGNFYASNHRDMAHFFRADVNWSF